MKMETARGKKTVYPLIKPKVIVDSFSKGIIKPVLLNYYKDTLELAKSGTIRTRQQSKPLSQRIIAEKIALTIN